MRGPCVAKIKTFAPAPFLSKTFVFERLERDNGIDRKSGENASQNSFLILASRKAYDEASLERRSFYE
jgi:hypothetical protein